MHIRTTLRRVPGTFRLAGLIRYLSFVRALSREERRYDSTSADIPPPRLRFRVHGALDAESYRAVGRSTANVLTNAFHRHGIAMSGLRVLDFGCGPGRVASRFKQENPRCELFGTDIDAEAIEWARANLSNVAAFCVNGAMPPLQFEDRAFDAAYTVSVFTHLDESSQFAWLQELARVVRPGGALIATVHGRPAHGSCSDEERQELAGRGFAYRVGHKGRLKLDGLPDSYQTSFHSRSYVQATWRRWFDVIEHIEGGLHEHQDVVVLRVR